MADGGTSPEPKRVRRVEGLRAIPKGVFAASAVVVVVLVVIVIALVGGEDTSKPRTTSQQASSQSARAGVSETASRRANAPRVVAPQTLMAVVWHSRF